jgi:hypothetical protein
MGLARRGSVRRGLAGLGRARRGSTLVEVMKEREEERDEKRRMQMVFQ